MFIVVVSPRASESKGYRRMEGRRLSWQPRESDLGQAAWSWAALQFPAPSWLWGQGWGRGKAGSPPPPPKPGHESWRNFFPVIFFPKPLNFFFFFFFVFESQTPATLHVRTTQEVSRTQQGCHLLQRSSLRGLAVRLPFCQRCKREWSLNEATDKRGQSVELGANYKLSI